MRSRFPTVGPSGRTGLGALLGALVLVTLSLGLGAAPAEAAGHRVTMQQYAYGPSSLSISQGDTVTWTNQDQAPHDVVVTSGPQSFRSPLLEKGESWTFTFRTAGTYSYTCSVHPDMRASVTVTAAPKATQPATRAPSQPVASGRAPATSDSVVPTAEAPVASEAGAGKHRKARRGTEGATSPSTAVTTAQVAPEPGTTLNPLLLVAGAAIAVVVFCLLLLASHPAVPARVGSEDGQG